MKKVFLLTLLTCAGFTVQVSSQTVTDHQPTEAEIAAYKRRVEILRHPTGIITIRLAPVGREGSTTPPPYTGDNWTQFEMFISLAAGEDLTYGYDRNRCYAYRPELIRDGDILSYTKEARECVERAGREPGGDGFGHAPETLTSGREYLDHFVNLEDWYETPLNPGHYQLLVRKQFLPNGDWVESNPVTFDVIPRKQPTPIPDAVSLRLVPDTSKPLPDGHYRLAYDEGVAVELINDSAQRVQVNIIDRYYGHRPQLIKDGKLIPYSGETAKLVEAKDKDARLVEVSPNLFLDPKTSSRLDGFSLKQWYGPLAPGVYHLTDRRRFEIGGPWTKDSAELVFEMVP